MAIKFMKEKLLSEVREVDPDLKIERLEKENKELQDQMLDFQEYVLQLELEKLMTEGGM